MSSTLSFPIRPDRRGTFAGAGNDSAIIEQSILDLLETRVGERVMMPNYGLPDLVFDVIDAGFASRLAFWIGEQIGNYLPAVESVTADAGRLTGDAFMPDQLPAPHQAAIRIRYRRRGLAVPQELIYPTWRLVNGNA
jgi:phage baseplate assembly protein W